MIALAGPTWAQQLFLHSGVLQLMALLQPLSGVQVSPNSFNARSKQRCAQSYTYGHHSLICHRIYAILHGTPHSRGLKFTGRQLCLISWRLNTIENTYAHADG
jgi:hypothetical protein